ncbi:MAG: type IX secretion system membrane protein PorP/SprF [Haliscomenobacter sp.]|nr:type IX secretion system membrane protein PorP/SprF [Haliscomenobacter sp.]MBP9075516.1 type IX secretion system membrane protein PorP/SprF [Haliscomenobacter sp.]MBP9872556.1 type IX secretion system membrane protein PorP/SprF [Haliscomenobacter sp.]
MRRWLVSIAIAGGMVSSLFAQQEEQYTQFMQYKLGLNPAYAGSSGGISISTLVRSQWIGLDGAPETQLVSFSIPVWNNNLGIGANMLRQTIGVTSNYTLETAYSYRIRAPRGFLHLGLQGSARLIRTDFGKLQGTQPIDQDGAIPNNLQSKFVPNFGAGLYYNAENFYFGLSVPRLLNVNIDLNDDQGTIAREVTHAYLMTGFIARLGDNLALQPQALFKYVKGAPFDADINLNLLILDRFTVGASYRLGGSKEKGLGESLAFLMGIQLSDKLLFGMSYDTTLSDLRRYNSGSIEGVLRFMLAGKSEGGIYDSPRFFF